MTTRTWVAGILMAAVAMTSGAAERKDAKAGDKGVAEGTIQSIERGIVMVKTDGGTLKFLPYWHGGMPKDGGGFDKDMLRRLESFGKGDRVRIEWTLEEHHRIDSILKLEDAAGAEKSARKEKPVREKKTTRKERK